LLFEEFLVQEREAGRLQLSLRPLPAEALVHAHCHQKAFAASASIQTVLSWIPGLAARAVETSCCGMAGAFGYEAQHYDVSMGMAEAALLPAVRNTTAETLIVADGFSCRHQIQDGTGRASVHAAQVLERALQGARPGSAGSRT
jgi:Fe-S oxidoreductase